MRKCILVVRKFNPATYKKDETGKTIYPGQIETEQSWSFTEQPGTYVFHTFTSDNDGEGGNIASAIIEDYTGQVHSVLAETIKFLEPSA